MVGVASVVVWCLDWYYFLLYINSVVYFGLWLCCLIIVILGLFVIVISGVYGWMLRLFLLLTVLVLVVDSPKLLLGLYSLCLQFVVYL